MECNAIKEFRVLDFVFYRCPIRRHRPAPFYPFTMIMLGAGILLQKIKKYACHFLAQTLRGTAIDDFRQL
ncbi:MAG: hypothetical protein KH230_15000 [Enterocloster asparagiformis]|nr:hypothetical protein [Enterocloster asparagiformis]